MKKKALKIICFAMTAILAVCCIAAPAFAAQNKGSYTFTVLGDSVAFGSYVEQEYRYGDVLKDRLTSDGYDVTYVNYSIPKYGSRSIYYDFAEDTFSFDNNAYVQYLGAPDYREGITYNDYITQLKNSDSILLNVGDNDILAKFYAMRGYDNYYFFYFNDRNKAIFENDIKNGNVDWLYTYNSKKAESYEKQFAESYSYYLEEDIKALIALNPDAQLIVNNVFNPYRNLVDRANTFTSLLDETKQQLLELTHFTSIFEFASKVMTLKDKLAELKDSGEIVFKSFFGTSLDSCGGIDISPLRTTQKILYKIQYARMEASAVRMFEAANEIIDNLSKKYGFTVIDIEGSDVCYNTTGDGAHPSVDGHVIIADLIYDAMEK